MLPRLFPALLAALLSAVACKPLPRVDSGGSETKAPKADGEFPYREYIDAVYNQHDPSAIDKYFSSSVVVHSVAPDAEDGTGTEYLKELAKNLLAAFPDVKLSVQEVLVDKDRLAARVSIEGTHKGDFAGIKPTGKSVKAQNFAIYRIEGGKIVEVWSLTDVAAITRQLGKK
ncbi:MAG: ester cyclase [Polyangiaceae bacterium]